MPTQLTRFWSWYERHYAFHVLLSTALFLLQIFHLYWLATHVVLFKLVGESYFSPGPLFQNILIAVDYTEIPAIISTSLLYINDLRKKVHWKGILFLLLLNSQWLHLFWITDEFVVEQFLGNARDTLLPFWIAWIAIMIDYLEIPVIIDSIRRVIVLVRARLSRA